MMHRKEYQDEQEDAMRMDIFFKNKKFIDEFNAKSEFQLGINHLSDWTDDELKQNHGRRPPVNHGNENRPRVQEYIDSLIKNYTNVKAPKALDWRSVSGVVSSVKDQGNCASDWAFAATGALEGQMHRGRRKMVSLSAQFLVDCDDYDEGCTDGSVRESLNFISDMGGIQADETYPYIGKEQKCRADRSQVVIGTSGPYLLDNGDENSLMDNLSNFGPIAVAINVSSKDLKIFAQYKSGVYKSKYCRRFYSDLNRSLLLVGYGTDPKEGDYWIVKNSMGEDWGENGYMRIFKDHRNMCGIMSEPIISV